MNPHASRVCSPRAGALVDCGRGGDPGANDGLCGGSLKALVCGDIRVALLTSFFTQEVYALSALPGLRGADLVS